MRKRNKIFLAIFLCMLLVFSPVIRSYRIASAVPIAVPISAGVITLIGAALVAAGWTFSSSEQVRNAAGNIFNLSSQEFRDYMLAASSGLWNMSGSWLVPLTSTSKQIKTHLESGNTLNTVNQINKQNFDTMIPGQMTANSILRPPFTDPERIDNWIRTAPLGSVLNLSFQIARNPFDSTTIEIRPMLRGINNTQHRYFTNTIRLPSQSIINISIQFYKNSETVLNYDIFVNGIYQSSSFMLYSNMHATDSLFNFRNELQVIYNYYFLYNVTYGRTNYVLQSADVSALGGLVNEQVATERGQDKMIGWPPNLPSISSPEALDYIANATYDKLLQDGVITGNTTAPPGTVTVDLTQTNTWLGSISATLQNIWSVVTSIPAQIAFIPQAVGNVLTGLFVPSQASLTQFTDIIPLVQSKAPFGYLTALQPLFTGYTNNIVYPKLDFTIAQRNIALDFGIPELQSMATTYRNIISGFMWLIFALGVIRSHRPHLKI